MKKVMLTIALGIGLMLNGYTIMSVSNPRPYNKAPKLLNPIQHKQMPSRQTGVRSVLGQPRPGWTTIASYKKPKPKMKNYHYIPYGYAPYYWMPWWWYWDKNYWHFTK